MAPIIPNLTYERVGVLISDSPGYKDSGTKFFNLTRIQSASYSFNHQAVDVKAIGSDKLIVGSNNQSPVMRAADLEFQLSYIFSLGQNETAAGLYVGPQGSILKNFFESTETSDKNIIIVSSNRGNYEDISLIDNEADFEGFNIISIGNAFLRGYSYQIGVGALPSCSLNYVASNIKYDIYQPNQKPTLPSFKLGANNIESSEELDLSVENIITDKVTEYVFDGDVDSGVSTIKPGDIELSLSKISDQRGGANISKLDALIQNLSIQVDIPRQDIYGMGSNFVFDRKLKLPVIAQANMEIIVQDYTETDVDSFITQIDVFDIFIKNKITGLETYSSVNFEIRRAQLKGQSYAYQIGSNVMVNVSMTFDITASDGLKIYFE